MNLKRVPACMLALTLLLGLGGVAASPTPLANAVVLIIRHGEKPAVGTGLAPAGEQRANAYVHYFETYKIDGKPLHLDHLIATKDTKKSFRERLTIEPLAKALGLPIDNQFKEKDVESVADEITTQPGGKRILICWHHGEISRLLQVLGANPEALLPNGRWPDSVFNWVIELRYDANGHLIPGSARRINEHLMTGDAD